MFLSNTKLTKLSKLYIIIKKVEGRKTGSDPVHIMSSDPTSSKYPRYLPIYVRSDPIATLHTILALSDLDHLYIFQTLKMLFVDWITTCFHPSINLK